MKGFHDIVGMRLRFVGELIKVPAPISRVDFGKPDFTSSASFLCIQLSARLARDNTFELPSRLLR